MDIVEATLIGAPTCNVSAHLSYVIAIIIDVWNDDPKHVIDAIQDFTKHGIED